MIKQKTQTAVIAHIPPVGIEPIIVSCMERLLVQATCNKENELLEPSN